MNDSFPLIPPFRFHEVVVVPWTTDLPLYGWIMVMGLAVALACGWVGQYLVLRRMSLVGDAMSHSVLPGLVIAYWVARGRHPLALFLGALFAALLTTVLVEVIHRQSRIKQDAALGITFSTLFALGVLLLTRFAGQVDLDPDCVLNGDLVYLAGDPPVVWAGRTLAPPAVLQMGGVALLTLGAILVFYKELLIASFDPGLAATLGFSPGRIHQALMAWLAIVVVSSFEAVGAILVIAMLVLPGATSALLTDRFPLRLGWTVIHAVLSSVGGTHLAIWLDAGPAGCMVIAGSMVFVGVWVASPRARLRGLLS